MVDILIEVVTPLLLGSNNSDVLSLKRASHISFLYFLHLSASLVSSLHSIFDHFIM